ncbi:MAG: membrane protein [Peptococcaceae bacterium BICA1-8]|nr:MAG: membrane protein [Peptococcaceae bacterium BICA1-8]
MLITLFRTIILYILVVVALRIMGKQQISQLQPFEFVLALMIAELATIPMEDTGIPLLKGVIPICILLFAQVTISYSSLKSQRFRKVVSGTTAILIKNGIILDEALRKNRYNINDLLEQLRIKNHPNVNEIEFAYLETNGEISVIPKAEKRPIVIQDLNLTVEEVKMPVTLILDGVVQSENLRTTNYDGKWLDEKLKMFNIEKTTDALIAILDTNGSFFAQSKEKNTV